ncbi:hypothetical protein CEXT_180511 [Caerostris extrusa]|uniref:Uncharacterized protein n=1 Tax=Caerostris extrusa TaxID=172846 RepID=A0AAV4X122_CAEEX|nr:hypothetical protein CEXT_180511 [Caerostris extrusa]
MGSQNRNRIIKDGNESDITESSDVVDTNSNPSQCSTIAISNIQGSETQNESDTDTSANGISTFSFVSNYQDKLLRILSNQLEIQKQSLAVQEKLIALMKNMSNCSPESQPLKIEVD